MYDVVFSIINLKKNRKILSNFYCQWVLYVIYAVHRYSVLVIDN
ncbi:unnamed protein product [Ilex paraguariensis]|uniref:Uncharacterized protein n=1 Tax=Ilex paraguariensis TaxID=185542 RepID=A0ABC8SV08_9AQUA